MSRHQSPPSVRLVDEVFARLKAIFGSQKVGGMFAQADAELVIAEWQQAIERHDRDTVHRALNLLAAEGGHWPPTLPEFIARVQEVRGEPMHRRALPVPRRTADEIARGRGHMDAIKAMVGRRRSAPVREPGGDAAPLMPPPACTCWVGLQRSETLCTACATFRANRDAVRMASDGTAQSYADEGRAA